MSNLPNNVRNELEKWAKNYSKSLLRTAYMSDYINHINRWKEVIRKDPELIWRMKETDAKDVNDIYVE